MMHTDRRNNFTHTFTDWKCKKLSSQELQTSKMLCVIYRIGAPPFSIIKLLIMHAAVRDTVGKLCFPSLFCIECLIKQLNCYACSSAEISSIIVTDSSTLTPRYFLSKDAYRLRNNCRHCFCPTWMALITNALLYFVNNKFVIMSFGWK